VPVSIARSALFSMVCKGTRRTEDGQVQGWVGAPLIIGLTIWGFTILSDTSNPCIEFERTEDGGECIRYADER
jgi:hypothetical protein